MPGTERKSSEECANSGADGDSAGDSGEIRLTAESEQLILRRLKESYESHLAEPVPDVFAQLLKRLGEAE